MAELYGMCAHCRTRQPVTELDGERRQAAQEDAQDVADYFTTDEHLDTRTGEACKGSGRTPESVECEDDDPYFGEDPGEFDEEFDSSAYDHDFARGNGRGLFHDLEPLEGPARMRNDSEADEVTLYGPRALD